VTPVARPPRSRWWSAVLAWALWGLVLLAVPTIAWWDHRLRQVGRPELAPLGESGVPYLLGMVSAATVGVVVASRRPATRWSGCCWPLAWCWRGAG
jgi:hypothetical protein